MSTMTKKYITEKGVHKINPDWTPTATAVPFANQATALAVFPSAPLEAQEGEDGDIVVTPMYVQAVEQYHTEVEPEIFIEAEGDSHHNGLEELNAVLAKYEVPAGMLSKLLRVKDFEIAEVIVDDSSSMTAPTDAKGPSGETIKNRWWEAKYRISQMMELLAYVVSPPVFVRFLNRPDVLELQRQAGELPKQYIERVESILMQAFSRHPSGSTPARQAIEASLNRYSAEQSVLRYFLGDGVPNGREMACRRIEDLLMHRPHPERHPFTFMSCTNEDAATEWMKECEEKAPYCSEFDDYHDESREILKDQGQAFPYSYGLHLVAQIVAAFHPHDLDAMDESVPFPKHTLDELLGYQSSPEEYQYYYDSFVAAQQRQLPNQTAHRRQFINQLPGLYQQFVSTAVASDIAAVAQYKSLLQKQLQEQGATTSTAYQQQQQRAQSSECCIIL